jgi:predicted ATPase
MMVDEALNRTIRLLERQGWASYQTLRRRFHLDAATLDALRHELVVTRQLAREEDAARLVWLGALQPASGRHGLADRTPSAMPTSGFAEAALPIRPARLRPLIGREAEDALLRERWQRVQQGEGQVVVVRGAAGIGKSHLVQRFRAHGAGPAVRGGEGRCSPTTQHSALYPVIDIVRQLAGLRPDMSASLQRQQLEACLAACQLSLTTRVPLLAKLLSIPFDTHDPTLALTPDRQRQQTLETIVTVLQRLALQQPLLLIVEDLHWADPSTLDVLERLIKGVSATPIYLLLTCRPECRVPGPPLTHVTHLTLNRLTSAQIEALVQRMVGATDLPPGTIRQIVERAEGMPLFAEELTHMVLSEPSRVGEDVSTRRIPTTLNASLQARLGQLGAALVVAQTAAVWGRAVTETQLQAVAPVDPLHLSQALERLVEVDMLYEVSLPPRITYVFKHALIQEAAYNSMTEAARRAAHERVAHELESQSPATQEALPELLAHHYTSAACGDQAVSYWQQAGQRAIERSAYLESISHLNRGLEILGTLPETPERIHLEIAMQRMLGASITATQGFAAPALASIYTRAQAQCRRIGDTELLFPVLQGLWRFHLLRGQLDLAWEVSEQLLELAEQTQDASQCLRAHNALGAIMLHRGDVMLACTTLEKGLEGYDLEQRRHQTLLYVQEPGAMNLVYTGLGLALGGYLDQALQRTNAALDLARDQKHPHSEVLARIFVAWVHQYRRERHAVREHAEAALHLAVTHRFVFWEAMARVFLAWACAADTGHARAAAACHQALMSYQGTGATLARTYCLLLLAECYVDGGDRDQCLLILNQAKRAVDASGEAFCAAELYRLEGDVLLQLGDAHHDAAAMQFRQALQLARHQQARLWELRTAISWGRLLRQRGQHDDAHALVAQVYQQFREGFDTPNLQAARSFLTARPV